MVLRILTIVALALMPAGMLGQPAAAQTIATASHGHCDDRQKPADDPTLPKAHCAACAALPAMDFSVTTAELRPDAPLHVAAQQWIMEPAPDTATPPPKAS